MCFKEVVNVKLIAPITYSYLLTYYMTMMVQEQLISYLCSELQGGDPVQKSTNRPLASCRLPGVSDTSDPPTYRWHRFKDTLFKMVDTVAH